MIPGNHWIASFSILLLMPAGDGNLLSTCSAQSSFGPTGSQSHHLIQPFPGMRIAQASSLKDSGSENETVLTPLPLGDHPVPVREDQSERQTSAYQTSSRQTSAYQTSSRQTSSRTGPPTRDTLITPPNQNHPNQAVLPNPVPEVTVATVEDGLLTGNLFFAFDAMFLARSGPSPQILAFTDGEPSLNTTSFSYDPEFSPGVTIGIGDPFGYAFEFSFLSSEHQFNGVVAGTTVVPVFFGGVPATPASSYTVSAEAQLDNYELNQWVSVSERARLGFGLRIIDMREEYSITETGTGSGFFCAADNELFGGQLTGQYVLFANEIAAISLLGKAGLYYNHVTVNATSQNAQINPDSDEFSFVGDLQLVTDLPLTDIFSFRLGYQATLLTRIAQALDQNDNLVMFNPANPGQFDFSSPSYRGVFFGLIGSY